MLTAFANDEIQTKTVRRLAYNFLLNYDGNILPISPLRLIKSTYKNVNISSMNSLAIALEVNVDDVILTYGNGLMLYDLEENKIDIFIDKNLEIREKCYKLSLAISFIEKFDGKIMPETVLLNDDDEYIYEFANTILAPNILLNQLGCENNIEIMKVSFLPFRNSLKKYNEIKKERYVHFIDKLYGVERSLINKFCL